MGGQQLGEAKRAFNSIRCNNTRPAVTKGKVVDKSQRAAKVASTTRTAKTARFGNFFPAVSVVVVVALLPAVLPPEALTQNFFVCSVVSWRLLRLERVGNLQ